MVSYRTHEALSPDLLVLGRSCWKTPHRMLGAGVLSLRWRWCYHRYLLLVQKNTERLPSEKARVLARFETAERTRCGGDEVLFQLRHGLQRVHVGVHMLPVPFPILVLVLVLDLRPCPV
jgi:hypothetical protein